MDIDEIKRTIEQKTGVPAALLDGKTAAENIEKARHILSFKRQHEAEQPKNTREQFSEWLSNSLSGEEQKDVAAIELDNLAAAIRQENSTAPVVFDGGEIDHTGIPDRTPQEAFETFIKNAVAYNPRRRADGWIRII